MKKILSICIPTFNRVRCLKNCLKSIYQSSKNSNISFEVCISDNCSHENIYEIIEHYKNKIPIVYSRNKKNQGLGVNILKAVSLAGGEYVWIIGNDDLFLKNTLFEFKKLTETYSDVDFFLINSYNLSSSYVFNFPQPFNIDNLPKSMKTFSKNTVDYKCKFFDLIDQNYAFDFLLGIFLSIFKRKKWVENLNVIKQDLISDLKVYSNIYNTCPHNLIFAKAFNKSNSFYKSIPLSVNLSGEREWSPLYPFVEVVRIPELLNIYKKNGLSFLKYLKCQNFAVRRLFLNLIQIYFFKKIEGKEMINFKKHIFSRLLYPSVYYFPIYTLIRKIYKKSLNLIKKN